MTLLILSCSKDKRAAFTRGRFADLYDGPMWRQVRASGFPVERVAAVSALYGFLEPSFPPIVETYDCVMDDERAARICGTGCHVARLADAVEEFGGAYMVGGELYRRVAEYAERYRPAIAGRVRYATGTYLQQRKQLGEWLRAFAS